jgi:hypothetical protein
MALGCVGQLLVNSSFSEFDFLAYSIAVTDFFKEKKRYPADDEEDTAWLEKKIKEYKAIPPKDNFESAATNFFGNCGETANFLAPTSYEGLKEITISQFFKEFSSAMPENNCKIFRIQNNTHTFVLFVYQNDSVEIIQAWQGGYSVVTWLKSGILDSERPYTRDQFLTLFNALLNNSKDPASITKLFVPKGINITDLFPPSQIDIGTIESFSFSSIEKDISVYCAALKDKIETVRNSPSPT